MIKNRSLSRSISDSSWGTIVTFLKYKSRWRGKNLIEIGRFAPSSKVHHRCGYYYKELGLAEREWECPGCGEKVRRDLNAAMNIKEFGLKKKTGVGRTEEPARVAGNGRGVKQEKIARAGYA